MIYEKIVDQNQEIQIDQDQKIELIDFDQSKVTLHPNFIKNE
jgi:hypothetical protein